MADNAHHRDQRHEVHRAADRLVELTARATAQQAVEAVQQSAIDASVAADEQNAAAAARQQAETRHKADRARAEAARAKAAAARAAATAKAARERARLAASRAAQRTALAPSPSASAAPSATTAATTPAPASSSKVDRLISFLKSQVGKPYVYGAAGPDSYDCSGLTQVAFGTVGVSLPRTSQEQSTVGAPVSISALQPGDLIFWGGEGSAYHVGVYIGDGQYLDAANPSTPVGVHQLADYMPDWAVRVL